MTDWPIKFTAKTRYRGQGYRSGSTITVTAGLHNLGVQKPYWSVTGEIREPHQISRGDVAACGCLHYEIARHWQELQPIIDMHLADDKGKPLYAIENGWYFLAGHFGGAGEPYHAGKDHRQTAPPINSLASHFRITVADAIALADSLKADGLAEEWGAIGYSDLECWRNVKAAFSVYVAAQADRWAAESAAGVALLTRLIAEQQTQGGRNS